MIDYYACIKLKFPTISDTAFELTDIDGNISITKWDEAYGQQPTMLELNDIHLSVVKKNALAEVKELRRLGLDKAALSAGILAIYDGNYLAAIELLEHRETTVLKNGMTAIDYLAGFGAKLGMSASQFASYVVSENRRVGPTAYEVEKMYLALTYAGCAEHNIPPINAMTSEEQILNAIDMYKTFCCI